MSEVSITRLVDTSIVIDFLRGSEIAKNWLNSFQAGELAISVVTAAELVAGCRNRREQN
jgi:predicted nucleic acid-binding protein